MRGTSLVRYSDRVVQYLSIRYAEHLVKARYRAFAG